MRRIGAAIGGGLYGLVLGAIALVGFGGAGHGLLFLPGSVFASPFVVLGPLGALVAPVLWAAVAWLAAGQASRGREWARILLLLHYAGLPVALALTRWVATMDWERLGLYRDQQGALAFVAVLYVAGQLWMWWLLRGGR